MASSIDPVCFIFPYTVEFRVLHLLSAVPASPRLHSTYTSSVVTVTDDDDPSGVFSFSPSSVNLELSEGSSANIVVQRQRGQFGAANVTVRTVILTSVVQDQRANLSDFTPLDFVMQFQVSPVLHDSWILLQFLAVVLNGYGLPFYCKDLLLYAAGEHRT